MSKPIFDKFVVGLTGGIGSGKSTVAQLFRDLGIQVVDADLASRAVVEPGSPALADIAQHFGSDILLPTGELDRAKLRTLIFSRKDEKQWLEDLLHPLIRQWIIEKLQASTSAYAILESPLLLETDQKLLVNRILIVDIPEDLQLGRAMARDTNSEQQIKNIMATQLGRKERLNQADDVIDNSKDIQHATKQVNELHTRYLQQAAI